MEVEIKRKIINIDRDKCTGCGECIPDCPEGALQIIDNKAVLVSDLFCDGLGACIKKCPYGAMSIIEREAEKYEEEKVMKNIIMHGENVIKAHLIHLNEHGENKYLEQAIKFLKEKNIMIPEYKENISKCLHSCPGVQEMDLRETKKTNKETQKITNSQLRQWPIQLQLLNPMASFFQNADLLISADCVPYSYGNFHNRFLKDKILITFCPKLDPYIEEYIQKIAEIIKNNNIKSITITKMEVPCCGGVNAIVERALKLAKKNIIIREYTISINGDII